MAVRQRESRKRIWRSFAEVTAPKRPPTPNEAHAIADVIELACRFDVGNATLADVRAATTGKQRMWATVFTDADDPAWRPLMALLDALLADEQRVVVTDQGTFSLGELIEADVKIAYEDGQDVLVLPYAHPWKRTPNPETGDPGERGEPLYRTPAQRGPRYGSFGAGVREREWTPREPEWWEATDDEAVPVSAQPSMREGDAG